jgi:hypothetical protein
LDSQLYAIVMEHLSKLESYVPGPLKKAGGTKNALLKKYRQDPLFSIFGLDSPEYAAATLAGGTITSIHRKIGDIYEGCVRAIFMAKLGQTADQVTYSATILSGTTEETRSADAYLQFDRLDKAAAARISTYCKVELSKLSKDPQINLIGVGLELRHCYETCDSKRIQADDAMARHLFVSGIPPFMPLFRDPTVIGPYRTLWIVKQPFESYDMLKLFSGYDFFDFLGRNRSTFRQRILKALRSHTE